MSKNSSDIQQRRRLLCLHPQSSYIHKFVDTPSCAQEGVPKKEAAFHTKDPHLFVTCVWERERERERGGRENKGEKQTRPKSACCPYPIFHQALFI